MKRRYPHVLLSLAAAASVQVVSAAESTRTKGAEEHVGLLRAGVNKRSNNLRPKAADDMPKDPAHILTSDDKKSAAEHQQIRMEHERLSMSPTRKAPAHRTRDFSERNAILGRSTLTRPTTIVRWRELPPRRRVMTPKAGPWQVVLPPCPVPPSASFCSPSYSSLGELAHHHNSANVAIACIDDGTSPAPTPAEGRPTSSTDYARAGSNLSSLCFISGFVTTFYYTYDLNIEMHAHVLKAIHVQW